MCVYASAYGREREDLEALGALEKMQNAKCKMQNRRQTESKECLLALPRCEGGKACAAGLMQNAELKKQPQKKRLKSEAVEEILRVTQWWKAQHTNRM